MKKGALPLFILGCTLWIFCASCTGLFSPKERTYEDVLRDAHKFVEEHGEQEAAVARTLAEWVAGEEGLKDQELIMYSDVYNVNPQLAEWWEENSVSLGFLHPQHYYYQHMKSNGGPRVWKESYLYTWDDEAFLVVIEAWDTSVVSLGEGWYLYAEEGYE